MISRLFELLKSESAETYRLRVAGATNGRKTGRTRVTHVVMEYGSISRPDGPFQ